MTAQASVRGKIMLAGEYAVLRGGRALAVTTAPEYALHVDLAMSGGGFPQHWRVDSTLWPDTTKEIDLSCESVDSDEAGFVSHVLRETSRGDKLDPAARGTLKITSKLDPKFGFGSSSALAVALSQAFHPERSALEHARTAWRCQKRLQGRASGYDALTQALSGDDVMLAQPFESSAASTDSWPHIYQNLAMRESVTRHVKVFVGGCGAQTGHTIGATTRNFSESDWVCVHRDSEHLIDVWLGGNLAELVSAVAKHRQHFAKTSQFPHGLFHKLAALPGWDTSWTCKTTGAGGEDAILFIGEDQSLPPARSVFASFGWHQLEGVL